MRQKIYSNRKIIINFKKLRIISFCFLQHVVTNQNIIIIKKMYFFLLFLFFKTIFANDFESSNIPVQPKYIIVASRQRSSSSTLAYLIGGHPCVLSGNEIWTNKPTQDILGAHGMVNMSYNEVSENPDVFLHKVHEKACMDAQLPDMCNGMCSISIKLFDIHIVSSNGLRKLMNDTSFFFVVLERDVRGEYCSHMRANLYDDWGITPSGHSLMSKDFICGETKENFISEHNRWFHTLRENLRVAKRFFMEIPFALVASCGLKDLVNSIYAVNGIPPGIMDIQENLKELFYNC